MTYSEAILYLHSLQVFGAKPGLDTIRKLSALTGNTQAGLRFIHVAGTNGKGSVCAMLEAAYRAAGYKTGLYTSPHLVQFGERIQVNRQFIPESDVARLVQLIRDQISDFPPDVHPTFFEVVTILALLWFAESKCDIVLWETGLGGRLDATNIVTPLASVITNIGHDHQQWLGETLAEIAFEKAGIIKRGVPVITSVEQPEAFSVIAETTDRKDSRLVRINTTTAVSDFPPDWQLALAGDHQKVNAMLALATAETLRPVLPISLDQVKQGLQSVHWPGRLQTFTAAGGRRFLLDGAHNPEGVASLCEALKQQFNRQSLSLIVGILADKDTESMATRLAPLFESIRIVPVSSNRTAVPMQLIESFRSANPSADIVPADSLVQAIANTPANGMTVIAGSLYLVGEAMECLGVSARPAIDERALNEFTVPEP